MIDLPTPPDALPGLRVVLAGLPALVAGALLTLYFSPLHAQNSYLFGVDLDFATINSDTPVSVHVSDEVTGGCWLTADAARPKVKRELLDAGFVNLRDEDEIAALTIGVSVTGYAATTRRDSCAVAPNMQVSRISWDRYEADDHVWTSITEEIVFQASAIMTGPKSGMSGRINAQIAHYIDEFIVALHEEKQLLAAQISASDTPNRHKTGLLNATRPLRR